MTNEERDKLIDDAFAEGTPIDEALGDAVIEALKEHKKNGNPVCEWRDGKVVWVAPEDIVIPD